MKEYDKLHLKLKLSQLKLIVSCQKKPIELDYEIISEGNSSIPVYNSLNDLKKNNDIEILLQPCMVYAHSTILRNELLQNENWVKELGIPDKQEFIKKN